MIRHHCTVSSKPGIDSLAKSLDKHMADELHTIIEQDPFIPGVIYIISIPMTDENWQTYNEVLNNHKRAAAVHQLLAVRNDKFDSYSGIERTPFELREDYQVLERGIASGHNLESISARLITGLKDALKFAGAGYIA